MAGPMKIGELKFDPPKSVNQNTAWLGELTVRELFVFLLKLTAASLLLAIVAIPFVLIFWIIAR